MPETDTVFLHYTQAELDRNYDQRAWDPESTYYIERYPSEAAAARKVLAHKSFAYGPGPDELLDLFLAQAGAPTILFVHGGAWRNFGKSDFSYLATQFVRAGFHCAIPNFSKLPDRRLPDVVEQLRRAVLWLHRNKAEFAGRGATLHICGHSSGAHLAAVLLTTEWSELGGAANMIGGASLISGSYDLEPALLSKRGSYIAVTDDEKRALSPMFLTDRIRCPVLVGYAERDTDEFRRQSEEFARRLDRSGRLYGKIVVSGVGHFAVLDELYRPGSKLLVAVLSHAFKSVRDSRQDG